MIRNIYTTDSQHTSYNTLNNFMREADSQLNQHDRRLSALETTNRTDATAIQVIKGASTTSATTPVAHGLGHVPELRYSVEASASPGTWHSGPYAVVDSTTGIINARVYMYADATNVYLVAETPSAGSAYVSALTFNAKYKVVGQL